MTTNHDLGPAQTILQGDVDMKEQVEMVEYADSGASSLLKSRFDEMSIWRTLWIFRRAAFYCVAVYTGYLCEGFEVRRCILSDHTYSSGY
jgi:hypothetical protein